MAKKKSEMQAEVEKSEQLDLLDVKPKNLAEIIEAAKVYKKYQKARLRSLDKEIEAKQAVLELIKAAKLQRLEDGSIKFKAEGFVFSVTPRDELIRIAEEKATSEESSNT